MAIKYFTFYLNQKFLYNFKNLKLCAEFFIDAVFLYFFPKNPILVVFNNSNTEFLL